MNCWHCGGHLNWISDSDWQDSEGNQHIVSFLECLKCGSFVKFYLPLKEGKNGL